MFFAGTVDDILWEITGVPDTTDKLFCDAISGAGGLANHDWNGDGCGVRSSTSSNAVRMIRSASMNGSFGKNITHLYYDSPLYCIV